MRGQLELAPHSGPLKGCSFAFGVDFLVVLVIQAYASGFENFGQSGFANIFFDPGWAVWRGWGRKCLQAPSKLNRTNVECIPASNNLEANHAEQQPREQLESSIFHATGAHDAPAAKKISHAIPNFLIRVVDRAQQDRRAEW